MVLDKVARDLGEFVERPQGREIDAAEVKPEFVTNGRCTDKSAEGGRRRSSATEAGADSADDSGLV